MLVVHRPLPVDLAFLGEEGVRVGDVEIRQPLVMSKNLRLTPLLTSTRNINKHFDSISLQQHRDVHVSNLRRYDTLIGVKVHLQVPNTRRMS